MDIQVVEEDSRREDRDINQDEEIKEPATDVIETVRDPKIIQMVFTAFT